jgi:hypothetical protein
MARAQGFVAVVGARVLPDTVAPQVAALVRGFWGIGSGGARLRAAVAEGSAACEHILEPNPRIGRMTEALK